MEPMQRLHLVLQNSVTLCYPCPQYVRIYIPTSMFCTTLWILVIPYYVPYVELVIVGFSGNGKTTSLVYHLYELFSVSTCYMIPIIITAIVLLFVMNNTHPHLYIKRSTFYVKHIRYQPSIFIPFQIIIIPNVILSEESPMEITQVLQNYLH